MSCENDGATCGRMVNTKMQKIQIDSGLLVHLNMRRNWPPSEDRGGMGPARSGVSPEMRRKRQNHESITKKAEMEENIVHFPFPPYLGHLVQTTQSLSFQSTTNAEDFHGTD